MQVRAGKVTEESGQTDCFKWVSPGECQMLQSGGTVVEAVASNVPSKQITSGGTDTITTVIPLGLEHAREESSRGAKITSIELLYKVATQPGTAISLAVYKQTTPVDGTAIAATAVAGSKDLSDANCYGADEVTITWTPTTAAFIAEDECWHAELVLTPANGTVFDFYGAKVNFSRAL